MFEYGDDAGYSTIVGGQFNTVKGNYAMAIGGRNSFVMGDHSTGIGGGRTSEEATDAIAIGYESYASKKNSIAIGNQSVATEEGTISFGHGAGAAKFGVEETSEGDYIHGGKDAEFNDDQFNADKDFKDKYAYTEDNSLFDSTYNEAYYNRLVNIGYGKDDHEAAAIGQTFELQIDDGSQKYLTLTTDGANDYKQKIQKLKIDVGAVAKDSTGFVTGGDVYNYMKSLVINNNPGSTGGTTISTLPEGEVKETDGRAISGSTAYAELRPENGNYVKKDNTTGANLKALDDGLSTLDTKVKANEDAIAKEVQDRKDAIDALNKQAQQMGGMTDAVSDLSSRVSRLDSRIDRVGAGAAALAALHPQDFDADDKWDFAAGYGHYRSANALALGAFYRPNEKTMFSLSGGENMVNLGVSLKFGKSNPYAGYSKAALITELTDQKETISTLSSQNEALQQKVADLEKQIQQILTKLSQR